MINIRNNRSKFLPKIIIFHSTKNGYMPLEMLMTLEASKTPKPFFSLLSSVLFSLKPMTT